MNKQRAYLMGLVGTGVTPSLTPPMHMEEARAQGLTHVYRPIDLTSLGLEPEQLPEILDWAERLGFDALNITHPCKRSVIQFLDRVDPIAAELGAVNTVLFTEQGRIGYNTDTTGFEQAFRHGLPGADLTHAIQVGAGGAGTAVADALVRVGVQKLTIVDLDQDRAAELAAELRARHPELSEHAIAHNGLDAIPALLAEASGIVHCTPVGMHDHPGTAFDVALLRAEHWVADIVYRPIETELVKAARALGCPTLDGGGMAVGQAADAFKLVTGLDADLDRMKLHFQSLLREEEALIQHQRNA